MVTAQEENELIQKVQSMSELELASFVSKLQDHIFKNKLSHVFDNGINSDLMEELRDKIADLEEDLEIANEKKTEAQEKLSKIEDIIL